MKRVLVPRSRLGMSLLEVLVSVFVLSVGLLGVAALLPIGQFNLGEAAKSDYSGACGRAALHEIKVRGWLNPTIWRELNSATFPLPRLVPIASSSRLRLRDAYVIDPLFIASNRVFDTNNNRWVYNAAARRFPLVDPTLPYFPYYTTAAPLTNFFNTSLPRVTFPGRFPKDSTNVLSLAAADQVFTWHDDQIFSLPDDVQERPRQMMMWDGGQGALYPPRPLTDGPSTPIIGADAVLKRLAEDNYSWMATVMPVVGWQGDFIPRDPNNSPWPYFRIPTNYLDDVVRYEVSIVVFHKRNFVCPAAAELVPGSGIVPQERSAVATMVGGGWGGGDVLLQVAKADAPDAAWLDVKKDGWLMLRGIEFLKIKKPLTGQPWDFPTKLVIKWYRVVAADEIIDGDDPDPVNPDPNVPLGYWGRYVTLAGPDWKIDSSIPYGTFDPAYTVYATLVDDVLGVYTTTVVAP